MRDKYVFSNGQALSTLDSTGVVSSNVFDMELDASGGNTILTDDQVEVFFNVQVLSSTNTAGDEGMDVELRMGDNSDMTTGGVVIASMHLAQADIAAGTIRSIKVLKSLAYKFLGAWFKATNTSLDNATGVDCWLSDVPDGSPNDSIQKVPS